MSSSPKKVLFKDFANEHRSKLSEKYPFLTNQQIQAKLKKSWKKVCQENKEMAKNNRSPRKSSQLSSNSVEEKKSPGRLKRLFESTGSPSRTVSGSTKSLESPLSSEVDSGPWYDEVTIASEPAESPKKSRDIFTESSPKSGITWSEMGTTNNEEETFKDVIDHKLNIEDDYSPEKDSNIVKSETVVSELFHPSNLSLGNEELCTVQSSRLLSSEQKEGDSNFNLMFNNEEEIFL